MSVGWVTFHPGCALDDKFARKSLTIQVQQMVGLCDRCHSIGIGLCQVSVRFLMFINRLPGHMQRSGQRLKLAASKLFADLFK